MIVIIVGLIGVKVNWKAITHQVIKYASITNSYRNVYRGFERYSGQMIRGLMNNRPLQYYNGSYFSILIAYGIFQVGLPKLHQIEVSEFGPLEVILGIMISAFGIALVFIRQRLTMVILNGIIGCIILLINESTRFSVNSISSRNNYDHSYCKFSRLPNIALNSEHEKETIKIIVSFIMAGAVVTLIFIAQHRCQSQFLNIIRMPMN